MTTLQINAAEMLKNIDSHLNREVRIDSLQYNKEALKFIIKNQLVIVRGGKVSRSFFGKNYDVVTNF